MIGVLSNTLADVVGEVERPACLVSGTTSLEPRRFMSLEYRPA